MNFLEFKSRFFTQKAFSKKDIAKEWPDFNFVNLVNWQKKGYLVRLRNTWYAFPDSLQTEADLFLLANRLRGPSYVSLETALRYYHFIPESVFSTISITTSKPAEWQTPAGHFVYRSIQPSLFFGYRTEQQQQVSFNIADPEKSLLDLLYFNPKLLEVADFEGFRLNKIEISAKINFSKIENYLSLIASPTLETRWFGLNKFLSQ
ncbi:MAG: hypothetical protein H6577_01975 [Lewinellaceae bacterium]|nr:hypothetical protein [Saprospiraceae bacterium]MCB9336875.1 hypothetical protein [Lewinellaceae bacterium]